MYRGPSENMVYVNDVEMTPAGSSHEAAAGLITNIFSISFLGLIRVALLVYPPPTRPLGPLPDPYPIPRGYLIPTGQKIK